MTLRGVIFDLDGTVIDSGLDFDRIRRDMGLPAGQPILEALDEMAGGPQKDECLRILREHELAGARRATLMPGVVAFLEELGHRRLRSGILTRNSREATDLALARLGLRFHTILTREEVPPKPDPAGLLRICEEWAVDVDEVLFVGDFLFDLETGRNAGVKTVLYAPGDLPDYKDRADFTIRDFAAAISLIAHLAGPT